MSGTSDNACNGGLKMKSLPANGHAASPTKSQTSTSKEEGFRLELSNGEGGAVLSAVPVLSALHGLIGQAQAGSASAAQAVCRIRDIIAEAQPEIGLLKPPNSRSSSSNGLESLPNQADELIHGTKFAHWPAIQQEGLRGAATIDFVVVDAKSRRGCISGVVGADLLIHIDVKHATEDGIQFSDHPSMPGTVVCHTPLLPVKYFSKVVDIRSGELVWDSSHGGSVKDVEFTPQRLQQMELYAPSRLRFTLHKAIDIAFSNGKSLKCSDFGTMDQLHYLGYECIDDFLGRFAPALSGTAAAVLDIGTGLGGSARYMWEQYGARVVGVEYQPELGNLFLLLNRLLQIPPSEVTIEIGDFAHMDLAYLGLENQFKAFTSQLVFLHIHDKSSLFERCSQTLIPGGYFMIEDFFVLDGAELSAEEKRRLAEDVSVPDGAPSTEAEYRHLLTSNGLVIDEWVDITDRWAPFIWDRCEAFLEERPALEAEHGADYGRSQAHFFGTIANLFHTLPGGDRQQRYPLVSQQLGWQPADDRRPQNLRGARIFGHKPVAPRPLGVASTPDASR